MKKTKFEFKHYADLAFLCNPLDYYIIYTLGKIHKEYDRELVNTDEAGALRRARIFYKYALEQINQDIVNSIDERKNELEKQKENVLTDYIIALQRLVGLGHENLDYELKEIEQIRKELMRDLYGALEDTCNQYNINPSFVRRAIDSLDAQGKHRERWIPKACDILSSVKGKISERALIVWATTNIRDHELIDVKGEGAYGVVFEAKPIANEKRAIKVIDLLERVKRYVNHEEIIEIVIREYENAKQQYEKHGRAIVPYVVRVVDATKDDTSKRYGIIQELMDGNFYRLQEGWENPQISEQNAKDFTLNLCEALKAIHSIKFFHRDLSPTNILYTSEDDKRVYKLGDFGLSQREGEINRLGMSIAAAYIRDPSPNPNDPNAPAMADLYAAGSNIILAYTGVQPFVEKNPKPEDPNDMEARNGFEEMLQQSKIGKEGIDALCAKLPAGLNEIVSKLMEPKPEKREIKTAEELYNEVKGVFRT